MYLTTPAQGAPNGSWVIAGDLSASEMVNVLSALPLGPTSPSGSPCVPPSVLPSASASPSVSASAPGPVNVLDEVDVVDIQQHRYTCRITSRN